jgi:3-oxoadipate enol-lactonase
MTPGSIQRPGARIAYDDTGGEGPAVVLIHGFGLDMRMWEPQIEALSAQFRIVRYDCRGFGSSGRFEPSLAYTHHDDLLALLDHLGIDQAALVGLSFGGRVALHTTMVAPARVRALVLLDAVLDGVAWDPESAAGLEVVGTAIADGGVAAGRVAWMAHPLFAAARERPELVEQLAAMVDDFPGQHWLGQDSQTPFEPPPIEQLETVDTPTLVIVGERDVPGFIEMADILATRIPHASFRRVSGAGHMVNMEAPETVNELLIGFLGASSTRKSASP